MQNEEPKNDFSDPTEIIFTELNKHIINTENKYLRISSSYLGIVLLIISVLSKGNNQLLENSFLNFIISVVLVSIGTIVYCLQKWYRMWKEHYIKTCNLIVNNWAMDNELKPYWLRSNTKAGKSSIDDILSTITVIFNFAITIRICYYFHVIISNHFLKNISTVVILLAFLLSFTIIKKKVKQETTEINNS
jgi:energy-converting hydrogenase Eha subunit C